MPLQSRLQQGSQHVDLPAETPFYIPATGSATRPRRALKCGDTFIVVDSHGDIGASAGGPDGLFHADTRFLSHLELRLNGVQPLLLGSNVRDDNTLLAVDLTNPDFYAGGQIALQKGHRPRRAHDLPLARHRLSAHRGAQSRRSPGRARALAAISTTISPTCSRCAASAAHGAALPRAGSSTRRPGAAELQGPRRRMAPHHADVRSAADRAYRNGGVYRLVLAPHESVPIFC